MINLYLTENNLKRTTIAGWNLEDLINQDDPHRKKTRSGNLDESQEKNLCDMLFTIKHFEVFKKGLTYSTIRYMAKSMELPGEFSNFWIIKFLESHDWTDYQAKDAKLFQDYVNKQRSEEEDAYVAKQQPIPEQKQEVDLEPVRSELIGARLEAITEKELALVRSALLPPPNEDVSYVLIFFIISLVYS